MRRRRESRPAVRKLIDIHFCPVLPPTCLFLSFPSSLSPAFLLFLLASLVTYIYIVDRRYRPRRGNLDYQRRQQQQRQQQQRTAGAPDGPRRAAKLDTIDVTNGGALSPLS